MERYCKRKNRESRWKRNPLQNHNGFPIDKSNGKRSSNLSFSSSSASAVSHEAPKICVRFSVSSNSCSSSSSSSSRPLTEIKSKPFSRRVNEEPNESRADISKMLTRSKENEISRKPFLPKSKKNQLQCISQRGYGKSNAKPTYKSVRRSKLSPVHGNPENKSNKGSQEFQAKMKSSREYGSGERAVELLGAYNDSNLNCSEHGTPLGIAASGYGLVSMSFGGHETVTEDSICEKVNCDNAIDEKTPPVEASLSPQIQCQSHSKMLVLKSAATPVCYGAGHLVSGVSDKRKCRRRGSLRGGPEKAIFFNDEWSEEDLTNANKESSIPLLAEASVRWHLSPCNEGHEDHADDSENKLDKSRTVRNDALGKLDLLSSHSILCGHASDSWCAGSSYSGSDSVGNLANKRRNRSLVLSPRKATETQGLLEPSNCNMVESLLATSPHASYSGNVICSNEGKHFSENPIGDNSKLSIGSLSSGNIIQTPDSDSSSEVCLGRSKLKVHQSNFFWPELDSITETLERVDLSSRSEISMWDAPALGFHFADVASPPISFDRTRLQKNVDSVSSWVSDTTLSNFSPSQMRISWQDGLGSRIIETDEFDCCCLSDEEINADGCASEQKILHPLTEAAEEKETYQGNNSCRRTYLGVESGENKENDVRIRNDLSPMLLDYEPCISTRGNKKSLLNRNAFAESICTDGDGLVASDDSDWSYLRENSLFQIK